MEKRKILLKNGRIVVNFQFISPFTCDQIKVNKTTNFIILFPFNHTKQYKFLPLSIFSLPYSIFTLFLHNQTKCRVKILEQPDYKD